MEYSILYNASNKKDEKPPVTSAQLVSALQDLLALPAEWDVAVYEHFVVSTLKSASNVFTPSNTDIINADVLSALGAFVKEGKTPAIRFAALDNNIRVFRRTLQYEKFLVKSAEMFRELQSAILNCLKSALVDEDSAIRQSALQQIGNTINHNLPAPASLVADILQVLDDIIRNDPDPSVRDEALQALPWMDNITDANNSMHRLNTIMFALSDENSDNRQLAVEKTGNYFLPKEVVVPDETKKHIYDNLMLMAARDPSPKVRARAIDKAHIYTLELINSGEIELTPLLEPYLNAMKDEDKEVRQKAVDCYATAIKASKWSEIRPLAKGLREYFNEKSAGATDCDKAHYERILKVITEKQIEGIQEILPPPGNMPR